MLSPRWQGYLLRGFIRLSGLSQWKSRHGNVENSTGISEPSTRPPAASLVITLLRFQLQRSRMVISQAKGFTRQEHEFMQDIAKKDYEDDLPELRLLFLWKPIR